MSFGRRFGSAHYLHLQAGRWRQ